tara:strand:- start:150 stop:458 length:309 start_codon:yes stop_codon:yes gene_type:complete
MSKIAVNGIVRDMTADEQAKFDAIIGDNDNHSVDTDFDRQMRNLRNKRDRLLSECDWTQSPDSPLTDTKKTEWATYRTNLRNLTNGLTTLEEVNAVVWPTKP